MSKVNCHSPLARTTRLSVKLLALFLVVSLVPVGIVGVTATGDMQRLSDYARQQSGATLETQVREELNRTVRVRSEEIGNLLSSRAGNVRSLAASAAVERYFAVSAGEERTISN